MLCQQPPESQPGEEVQYEPHAGSAVTSTAGGDVTMKGLRFLCFSNLLVAGLNSLLNLNKNLLFVCFALYFIILLFLKSDFWNP